MLALDNQRSKPFHAVWTATFFLHKFYSNIELLTYFWNIYLLLAIFQFFFKFLHFFHNFFHFFYLYGYEIQNNHNQQKFLPSSCKLRGCSNDLVGFWSSGRPRPTFERQACQVQKNVELPQVSVESIPGGRLCREYADGKRGQNQVSGEGAKSPILQISSAKWTLDRT